MNENVILLLDNEHYECWGSLTEICKVKGFSYNYLKRKKFPFIYKKLRFVRVPFRKENGI
jgi:hypothetical protein